MLEAAVLLHVGDRWSTCCCSESTITGTEDVGRSSQISEEGGITAALSAGMNKNLEAV